MVTARKIGLTEYILSNRIFILNLRAIALLGTWAIFLALCFLLYRGVVLG